MKGLQLVQGVLNINQGTVPSGSTKVILSDGVFRWLKAWKHIFPFLQECLSDGPAVGIVLQNMGNNSSLLS